MEWNHLVEGRTCGTCTVCCKVPAIDDPEIQKEAGETCRNCQGGCTIYETRPQPCRVFHCAWRRLETLGDEWRPDRSGVLSLLDYARIGSQTFLALTFMLISNPAETATRGGFVDLVRSNILRNTPIYLSLPGSRGRLAQRTLLNSEAMMQAAVAGDPPTQAILAYAVDFLEKQPSRPHVMQHSGNDTGATPASLPDLA